MKQGIDYIYVPLANISESTSTTIITNGAIYFTRLYVFILPIQKLNVLLAGINPEFSGATNFIDEINSKIHNLELNDFHQLMISRLDPENVYCISELDVFKIQVGFWIFGGILIKKKGNKLYTIDIQPRALREEIQQFYI